MLAKNDTLRKRKRVPYPFDTHDHEKQSDISRPLPAALRRVLDDLLVEQASLPDTIRTVSGCVPPAPRLVGIELNPGPRRGVRGELVALGADGARALGAAFGNLLKKKKKKASKPAPSKGLSAMSTRYTSSVPRAPNNQIPVLRAGSSSPPGAMRISFDQAVLPIYSDAAGKAQFGSATSGIYNLELDPNATVATIPVFGFAIANISNNFRQAKLLSLRVHYVPMSPSTEYGAISLAVSPDSGIITTDQFTFNGLMSQDGAVTFPVWTATEVPSRARLNETIFIHDPVSPSVADQRQTSFGKVLVTQFAPLLATRAWGILRLTGELEFSGLGQMSTVAP